MMKVANTSMIQEHADRICEKICDTDHDGKLSADQVRQKVMDRLIAMGHDEVDARHAASVCI